MAEKLCTLRTKGGGGGKYTETSLWTNQSPTSAFANQTVTLSDSVSNYKYIKFVFRFSTSNAKESSAIYSVDDVVAFSNSDGNFLGSGFAYPTVNVARSIIYKTATSIEFGTCYRSNTSGTYNSNLIPIEILGLNELDHGTMTTSNVEVFPLATVTGGTQPTYTTKGRAVAIWQMWGRTDNVGFGIRTNVNPTTGAINNNEIYMSQNNGMSWTIQSAASFTVTDTTITTTAISSNNRVIALAYTY